MTAQISETLYYEDQVLRMSSQPLDDYFTLANIDRFAFRVDYIGNTYFA